MDANEASGHRIGPRNVPARSAPGRAGAAGLLALSLGLACGTEPVQEVSIPRVLMVSIDTCRADHLSVYGYGRETSPFLESLGREGVVFDRAITQATDTTPSHASIFTSVYPFRHGAANGVPLRGEFTTLAEMLRADGYRTAGFVSGWTMVDKNSGLGQGFEVYDDTMTHAGMPGIKQGPTERRAEDTTDLALAWLEENGDAPFFLFVHYFDAHGQYNPPPPYDEMFPPVGLGERSLPLESIPRYTRIGNETDPAVFEARYDGEIRYVDDQIARIAEDLKARGLWEDTLVVVTSDHGESLTEHGSIFSHGWLLYEPSVHVPLLISHPPTLPAGARVAGPVETLDVVPTVLEILGMTPPNPLDGVSLMPLIRGETPDPPPHTLSTTTKNLTQIRVGQESESPDLQAVRFEGWKYIRASDGSSDQLFDLERDPAELEDLSAAEPTRLEQMQALLGVYLEQAARSEPGSDLTLEEAERLELEEQLRALGYVR